jgi:predicted nucleic acid-binding protein
MGVILDTNALSAFADENPSIIAVLDTADEVSLPVIALGEYRYGVAQSRHRARYEQWLTDLLADCDVLDVTEKTTHHYAAINIELRQSGNPIPTNDLWIAALCRQHDLPVLTRDRHFDLVQGIRRISW